MVPSLIDLDSAQFKVFLALQLHLKLNTLSLVSGSVTSYLGQLHPENEICTMSLSYYS